MNYKFEVGDKVRILDGSKIEDYFGTWNPRMSNLVGKVYTITDRNVSYNGKRFYYEVNCGKDWVFDERGLELVYEETEEPITIRDEYSKNGRHVVTATQNTEYGILIGKAICHPEDKFDYDFGVILALGRLLQAKLQAKKEAKRLEELKKKNAATSAEYTTTAYICW